MYFVFLLIVMLFCVAAEISLVVVRAYADKKYNYSKKAVGTLLMVAAKDEKPILTLELNDSVEKSIIGDYVILKVKRVTRK